MLNVGDFHYLQVQEKLHIVISVKDFKAMVNHADSLDTMVSAHYSSPGRPLQFNYEVNSVYGQFTLMTAGEYRGETPQPTAAATFQARASMAASSRATTTEPREQPRNMAPPPKPDGRRNLKTLGRRESNPGDAASQPQSTATSFRDERRPSPDSLFIPLDDDQAWDPPEYERTLEETLEWDSREVDVCFLRMWF
jgi:cell cycle checkpoint control protein RAD9A